MAMQMTLQSDVILCGSGFCSAPATRKLESALGDIFACDRKNHDHAALESFFDLDEDDCEFTD